MAPADQAVIAIGVVSIVTLITSVWNARRSARQLERRLHSVQVAGAEVRRLLDQLPEAVLLVDRSGIVRSCNASALELFDLVSHELIDTALLDHLPPERRSEVSEALERALRGLESEQVQLQFERSESRRTVVEASLHLPYHYRAEPDAVHDRVIVRLRDVSEREQHARALHQARRRFQQAFQSAPTGMALVRLDDDRIVDANQSLADMLRRDVGELVGRTLREFTHPKDVAAAGPDRARLQVGIEDSYRIDQRYRRSDGEYVWARARVSTTEDDGALLAITHIEDVTEQRRAAEQLRHAARHDELTGLPNRSFLLQLLEERLESSDLDDVSILFVDLDQFKVVNDSLGHDIGDQLIQVVSKRLRSALREDDVLARFGGDEFVVMMSGEPADVAERLRRAVQPTVQIGEHEMHVTVSIGIATNREPQLTPGDLLRYADAAMYRAKNRGRNCVESFELGGNDMGGQVLRTANELRHGIARKEIVPYFQPIVDLESGRIVSFEVLARWQHPDRGLLPPSEFLPLSEETGSLVELGAGILRDALAQLAQWRAGDHEIGSASLSVNVGTRQLMDPNFYDVVRNALAETGTDADALTLEITESALLADVKSATVALRKLRSLGLHLSVDDFGTGYSSLTYLKRFPVESIKIDRTFVAGLGIDSDDSSIVDAVVRLGQSLGLKVVAEGVESPLQLNRLRGLNCDLGQGYLFGHPQPADLITRHRATV